jgi:hypothetical protein
MINYLLPIDQPLEERKINLIQFIKNKNTEQQTEIINDNNNKDPKKIKIDWNKIIGYEKIKKQSPRH